MKKKIIWIICVVIALITTVGLVIHFTSKKSVTAPINQEKINSQVTQKVNYDADFKDLKEQNQKLYDSLKIYEDQISFLTQFKYKKTYVMDTVWCDRTVTKEVIKGDTTVKTYTYKNDTNDSINYVLHIGSKSKPSWYTLKTTVSDQFTIVNKKDKETVNVTDIKSENSGDVSSVVVYNQKKSKNIFNKIAIGPSITYGYDFASKKMAPTIGISVTYNIFGTK